MYRLETVDGGYPVLEGTAGDVLSLLMQPGVRLISPGGVALRVVLL